MTPKRIVAVQFSGTGTTRKIVNAIADGLGAKVEKIELLKTDPAEDTKLAADDIAVVGMPVYGGRIPPFARKRLAKIQGSGTPAVAVAVYGNRDYDDALIELVDVLSGNGFTVFAAGAFLAEHSIFPKVAAGRPDAADMEKIASFARECADRIAAGPTAAAPIRVKGNHPYLELKKGAGLQPSIDKATCILCGACAKICPTGSLLLPRGGTEVEKDVELCIPCSACVKVCPNGTQAYRGTQYQAFAKVFEEKNAARREPETFFA